MVGLSRLACGSCSASLRTRAFLLRRGSEGGKQRRHIVLALLRRWVFLLSAVRSNRANLRTPRRSVPGGLPHPLVEDVEGAGVVVTDVVNAAPGRDATPQPADGVVKPHAQRDRGVNGLGLRSIHAPYPAAKRSTSRDVQTN